MNAETLTRQSVANIRGLRALDLDTEYRTGEHDLLWEFYRPCLQQAYRYDRASGYFRSTIYDATGELFIDLASRGGRVRLVCSPELTPEDVEAIRHGYRERDARLAKVLTRQLDEILSIPALSDRHAILATLVSVGTLDIRLAILPDARGLFHEKLGIFVDRDGYTLSFKGSANETWSGWDLRGNVESFEVWLFRK